MNEHAIYISFFILNYSYLHAANKMCLYQGSSISLDTPQIQIGSWPVIFSDLVISGKDQAVNQCVKKK